MARAVDQPVDVAAIHIEEIMIEHAAGPCSLVPPPALGGRRVELDFPSAGPLSWYQHGPGVKARCSTPLLLIHGINAASSAYEVKPLYDYYARERPVYALELPGFGYSARTDRLHTPRLMTDAIHAAVTQIRREIGCRAIDALALSLSAQFLARAAVESPAAFRSIGLVSPAGFAGDRLCEGPPHSTLGRAWLRSLLKSCRMRRGLYRLLTRRRAIQNLLQRTWGSCQIDSRLLNYGCLISRPAGAEFAAIDFLAGYLFSRDSGTVYRQVTIPVWVLHGNRGDHCDFRALRHMSDRPNWTVEVLATGALPHFERPGEFIRRYDDWSAQLQTQFGRDAEARAWSSDAQLNRRSSSSPSAQLADVSA
jgi:pimeloyl-ACP methyl ester carboxylesterase